MNGLRFNVLVDFVAKLDVDDALEYYFNTASPKVAMRFAEAFEDVVLSLEHFPLRVRIRANGLRSKQLEPFPYLAYYSVDENQHIVVIERIVHASSSQAV